MSKKDKKTCAMIKLNHEQNTDDRNKLLNDLAHATINFMNKEVQGASLPNLEKKYIMLHAAEAITFNIIMSIYEQSDISPEQLAEKTKHNLFDAIEQMQEFESKLVFH